MGASFDLGGLGAAVGRMLDEGLAALAGERGPLQVQRLACLVGLPLRDPYVPTAAADVIASAGARRPEPAPRELAEVLAAPGPPPRELLGVLATLGPRRLAVAAREELGDAPVTLEPPVLDAVRAMTD